MLSEDSFVVSGTLVVLDLHGLGMWLVDACGHGMQLGGICGLECR